MRAIPHHARNHRNGLRRIPLNQGAGVLYRRCFRSHAQSSQLVWAGAARCHNRATLPPSLSLLLRCAPVAVRCVQRLFVRAMEDAGVSLLPRSPSGLFWRALSLPYRSSEGAPETAAVAGPLAASSLALGRPSRASLDALGPSCSLGAPAQAQSRHARSSSEDGESLVLAAPQEACADADVVAQPHAQRPPRPPSAQRRPLNARGAEAALRSTNPIRKARPHRLRKDFHRLASRVLTLTPHSRSSPGGGRNRRRA